MQEACTQAEATRVWTRRVQLLVLCLALVLLYGLARPMLGWMRFIFAEPSEDMGHGWLVPVFSLYLLWHRRRLLLASIGAPSWKGVLLCVPWLALLWLGERGDQARVSQIAVFGLLGSIPCAVMGRRFASLTLFPVLFLAFTVPIGFLDFFTVRLRLLTAVFSSFLLNGIGIPVARVGTGLHCLTGAGFALDVADPCSGLRSIFALTAITAAYAYLTQRTLWQKWLLFACSIPLAVLGNMARIFTIALVAKYFGQSVGTGFYHDYSGYLVFIVGTLLMMQVGAWISRMRQSSPAEPAKEEQVMACVGPCAWRQGFGVALLILALVAMRVSLRRMPPPTLEPQDFLTTELSDLPGYRAVKPWYCQNEQCRKTFENQSRDAESVRPAGCPECGGAVDEVSLGERTVLPDDTRFLKSNYYDAQGNLFRVSVVINGASRQSIHRPELCLPAQGFSIERTQSIGLPVGNGVLPVKVIELRRIGSGGQSRTIGQAYFFVSAHHRTASHYVRMLISIRDRALYNRVTRWAMVAIAGEPPFDTPDRHRAMQDFFGELYPAIWNQSSDDPH